MMARRTLKARSRSMRSPSSLPQVMST
jgi:hypothetical protein